MEFPYSTMLEAAVGITMGFPATVLAWRMFKGDHFPIILGLILAFGGFYLSYEAGKILAGFIFPASMSLVAASLVAAAAATDPVAVEATMKILKGKTTALLESLGLALTMESLFNDPVSLREFWIALGQAEKAEHSIALAFQYIAVMVAVTIAVLVITKGNRQASSSVRKIVGTGLILLGMTTHAALITIGVVGNFIAGLVEGWFTEHHHIHQERLDTIGGIGSYGIAIVAAPLALMCAATDIASFFIGVVFMSLYRLLPFVPTLGAGILWARNNFAPYRAGVFGRAGAIGVITIAAMSFYEAGAYSASALLAGCAAVSILLFAPLAYRDFTRQSRNSLSVAAGID